MHYKSKVYSKRVLITYNLNYIALDTEGNKKRCKTCLVLVLKETITQLERDDMCIREYIIECQRGGLILNVKNPMEMEVIKTGAGVEASWSRSVVKNNGETHERVALASGTT